MNRSAFTHSILTFIWVGLFATVALIYGATFYFGMEMFAAVLISSFAGVAAFAYTVEKKGGKNEFEKIENSVEDSSNASLNGFWIANLSFTIAAGGAHIVGFADIQQSVYFGIVIGLVLMIIDFVGADYQADKAKSQAVQSSLN